MAFPIWFQRRFYRLWRGGTRVVTLPARLLPEGPLKTAIRRLVLRGQHSLPTEFIVNAGDIVVQIGTPWPKTVQRFSRAAGPKGRVFVVEAMPRNQARLEAGIAQLGLANVTLIKGAASSHSGMGRLAVSAHDGDHKIALDGIQMDNDLRPENAEMDEIDVPFHALDDVLAQHGVTGIDVLSVTVNGAELEVLKGAETLLRASAPGARVYTKGHALDEAGVPLNRSLAAFLQQIGYQTQRTKGELSSAPGSGWEWRDGDVYAWKSI